MCLFIYVCSVLVFCYMHLFKFSINKDKGPRPSKLSVVDLTCEQEHRKEQVFSKCYFTSAIPILYSVGHLLCIKPFYEITLTPCLWFLQLQQQRLKQLMCDKQDAYPVIDLTCHDSKNLIHARLDSQIINNLT